MTHRDVSTSVFGWLEYDQSFAYPHPQPIDHYTGIDDMDLIPYDDQPLLASPDHVVTLEMNMGTLQDGITQ